MSFPLLGLRTVIYPAPDLAGATRWWTDFLGAAPYFQEPLYVGFEVAGYELGLLPDADPADGALTYWGVDDVRVAVDAAVEAGCEVNTPAAEVGVGIVTASVRRTNGTVIGFVYNPHFSLA